MPARAEDSSFAHSRKSYAARDDDLAGGLDIFSHADNVISKPVDWRAHVVVSRSSPDYDHGGDDLNPFDVGSDGDYWDPEDGFDEGDWSPYDSFDDGDWSPYDGYD